MIRGAFILAVGFALGYAKATSQQESVRRVAETVLEKLKEDGQNKPDDVVDGTATETPQEDRTQEGDDEDDRG